MEETVSETAEAGNALKLHRPNPFEYTGGMPTNVTPEYRKAEEAFRNAAPVDEKIERLEDMIALLPKHNGTDHGVGG